MQESRFERLYRLSKEGGWIILGQALAVVGALAGVRLLTELMTPAAYGELALGLTLATFVNQIIFGPLSGGVLRFYAPAIESSNFTGYLNTCIRVSAMVTAVVFGVGITCSLALEYTGHREWAVMSLAAMIFSISGGLNAIVTSMQTAARHRAVVAVHQGADAVLRAATASALLLVLGNSSAIAMLGYAIASLIVCASQWYRFRKMVFNPGMLSQTTGDWQQRIWSFSWPIGFFGIFTWLQLISDRWALQYFASAADVGTYAVLFQIGSYPITLLAGISLQFLVPVLYQRAGDAADEERNIQVSQLTRQMSWFTLGLAGLVCTLGFFLHGYVFQILVAEQFRFVSYLMPWVMLSAGFFSAAQTLSASLQAQLKTRQMLFVKIVTAILGVAVNVFMAYVWGVAGVVYAGLIFSIIYFLWILVLEKKGCE